MQTGRVVEVKERESLEVRGSIFEVLPVLSRHGRGNDDPPNTAVTAILCHQREQCEKQRRGCT